MSGLSFRHRRICVCYKKSVWILANFSENTNVILLYSTILFTSFKLFSRSGYWFLCMQRYSTVYTAYSLRMKKLLLLISIFSFSLHVAPILAAENTDASTLVESLRSRIQTYERSLATLEAENAMLRSVLASNGINVVSNASGGIMITGSGNAYISPAMNALSSISTEHSPVYAGMIERMQREWKAVRENYRFPAWAIIWEYEFVNTGAVRWVFVDVIFSWGVLSGSYDAKLLYHYDAMNYERKLVWLFIFDSKTRRYITVKWSNPYTVSERTKIRSPYLSQYLTLAWEKEENMKNRSSTGTSWVKTGATFSWTQSWSTSWSWLDAVYTAYKEKRYLSVVSLSNEYLVHNTATLELLKTRYRSYFIIGKYKESLAEIQKIQEMYSPLEKTVACDGSVIASYAKNTTLSSQYKSICNN